MLLPAERDKLKELLQYSRRLGSFARRSQLLQESLEELLENDDDLALAYLSARAEGEPRSTNDHEEFETFLESYANNIEQIVTEVGGRLASTSNCRD